MKIEGPVQPLYSFDSFELIAVNLTESNVDDNSVSSKAFEINDMEAKEFGLKLRRGRRMAVNGENWSAPVRSRRSRLGYAGRRHFS